MEFCSSNTVESLNEFFDHIILVPEDSKPTQEQIKKCLQDGYDDMSVGSQSEDDWYCLLRNLQGNFMAYERLIKDGTDIYMIDRIDFIHCSLCDYAYIINLDEQTLEFYKGVQKGPQEGNRYGTDAADDDYYLCKLVLSIPLDETDDIDSIVEAMKLRKL